MAQIAVPVFQIRITLHGSQPSIWRRFLVPSDTKLSQLHEIVQTVMGWQNSHLHMFKVGEVRFATSYEPGDLEEVTAIDDRQVSLHHLVAPRRPFRGDFHFAMDYEYDFGDGWSHELIFEDILDPDPKREVPFCVAGERACPPEDSGGIHGYETLLDALKNPDDPENTDQIGWLGEGFDPEKFDVEAVNVALRA